MRAYVSPIPVESWGLRRVAEALVQYAPPGVELVGKRDEAELVVLHVIGRQDRNRAQAARLRARGQRYAVVQYCVRSTLRPSTEGWLPLWRGAALVWSYYDLRALCAEDGAPDGFPFYHAPLGVDAEAFYPRQYQREYVVGTSGLSWLTESVREAVYAAQRVNRPAFHLGPDLKRDGVTCVSGVDDATLAGWYSRCQFIAGLRRTEGFELPAAEGLLCGARPVCFDRAHYRQWFEPWAVFVPEEGREAVMDSLEAVFRQGARPVTEAERTAAAELFNWGRIIKGFWHGCLH